MSIPTTPLDDLTWADLTAAARGRIPAASKGRWTLHAPVDPGVTLLELHAWLLEQRLYWMDQVPDSLTRGALTLLGEGARDAQSAVTVLHFTADQECVMRRGTEMMLVDSDPPLIFTIDRDLTVLPFDREKRGDVGGPPLFGLRVGGKDRAADLKAGREICMFQDDGEVEVTLRLRQPLDGTPGELALMFLLGEDNVPPEWAAEAATVPPPATLSFSYAGAGGTRKSFSGVSDGTGGLRRSGIMRLPLPVDWTAPAPDQKGIRSYSLWIGAGPGFTASPQLVGLWPNTVVARHARSVHSEPEVDWLPLPNIQIALGVDEQPPFIHGTRLRIRESDDRWHSWVPTADLAFHGREDRVFVVDRDAGTLTFGNGETGRIPVAGWGFTVRDVVDARALALALQNPNAPVSVFLRARLSPQQDALIAAVTINTTLSRALLRALLSLLNGVLDDPAFYNAQRFTAVTLRGATKELIGATQTIQSRRRLNRMLLEDAFPSALACSAVRLELNFGGGIAGNVGSLCQWEPALGSTTDVAAINVVAATGGAEREPLADARQRAAAGLRRVDRAVIGPDYEWLARTTPGVAIRRAHAAIGVNGMFPCVAVPGAITVFIVPDAPGDSVTCPKVVAPQPDAGALSAVAARLEAARLLGTELYVRAPIYRDVDIAVHIESDGDADEIVTDVAILLGEFLDPLVGGEEGGGWPFGRPLTPSVLLRRVQDEIGNRGEVVRVGIRLLDSGAGEEDCNDVLVGPHALPALREIKTRIITNRTPFGGLQ
jgi:hypothetical protein